MATDGPGRLAQGQPLKGKCRWCKAELKPHGEGLLVCEKCDTAPPLVPA